MIYHFSDSPDNDALRVKQAVPLINNQSDLTFNSSIFIDLLRNRAANRPKLEVAS